MIIFIFASLEYYPENGRWFLKSLLPVKDEEANDSDEAIRAWIHNFGGEAIGCRFSSLKSCLQRV